MVRGGGVKQVVAHSHVFGSAEGEGGQRWQNVVVRAPTVGQAAVSGAAQRWRQVYVEWHGVLPASIHHLVVEDRPYIMVARDDEDSIAGCLGSLETVQESCQRPVVIPETREILTQDLAVSLGEARFFVGIGGYGRQAQMFRKLERRVVGGGHHYSHHGLRAFLVQLP